MREISLHRNDNEDPEEQTSEEAATAANKDAAKSLYESRTILIFGEINAKLSERVSTQLLALAADSDEDIRLIINSPGGHVESGDTIVDLIRFITPKVKVLGSGWVASMGALIYLAAEPEDRYSLAHTRYMLHQPLGGAGGSASDIAIEAREIVKMRERIDDFIANATGQSLERVRGDTDRNYWMSPEEAREYGMVGKIITRQNEF